MTREQVREQLYDILVQNFRVDRTALRDDALVQHLGLDSLDVIDLIFFIREKLGVKHGVEEYRAARTLGAVVDIVHAALPQAPGGST